VPESPVELQAREYLLIPLVMGVGTLFVYAIPPVGLPLAALVLGRFVYAGAGTLAIVTALLGAVAPALFSVVVPAISDVSMIAMTLPVLLGLVWAARAVRRLKAWQVFAVITLVAFVGFIATTAIGYGSAGASLSEGIAAEVDIVMDGFDELFLSTTMDATARLSYGSLRESLRMWLRQIWPGLNLVMIALGAALSTLLLARLSRAHGVETSGPAPLDRIDVSWHMVWPLIAALGILAATFYAERAGGVAAGIGWNLLIVSLAVFVVQGLGVSEASLKRLRLRMVPRVLIYGLMLWTGALMPVLALLGVADMWVNFRRLPRNGTGTQDIVKTPDTGGVE
jgi:hypothetical protein